MTIRDLLTTRFLPVTVFFSPLKQQTYVLRREQTATSDTISSQGEDICQNLLQIEKNLASHN